MVVVTASSSLTTVPGVFSSPVSVSDGGRGIALFVSMVEGSHDDSATGFAASDTRVCTGGAVSSSCKAGVPLVVMPLLVAREVSRSSVKPALTRVGSDSAAPAVGGAVASVIDDSTVDKYSSEASFTLPSTSNKSM